jgi:hypothetical protein
MSEQPQHQTQDKNVYTDLSYINNVPCKPAKLG